jgi:hypothetical protein
LQYPWDGEPKLGQPGGRGDLRGVGMVEKDAGPLIDALGWRIWEEIAEFNSAVTVALTFTTRDLRA